MPPVLRRREPARLRDDATGQRDRRRRRSARSRRGSAAPSSCRSRTGPSRQPIRPSASVKSRPRTTRFAPYACSSLRTSTEAATARVYPAARGAGVRGAVRRCGPLAARHCRVELLQLVRHRRAHEDLRIRRRREPARLLALGDAAPARPRTRPAASRTARARAGTAPRRRTSASLRWPQPNDARSACRRGEDERVVVLQRLDEAAGIARRDDDDPPLDAGVVEQPPQRRRA